MTPQEYKKRLLELRKFLKENPDQRKTYSDINISAEILRCDYEIMKGESKNEKDRLYSDGFETTSYNPFL